MSKPMSTTSRPTEKRTAVDHLSFSARTARRVAWESWEFTLAAPSQVRVTNASYGYLKDEHTYVVDVEDCAGVVVPVTCECPADINHEPDCKHKVALATVGGPVVLDAAVSSGTSTDDGRDQSGDLLADFESPDTCPACATLSDLPCWECYQMGVRNLKGENRQ